MTSLPALELRVLGAVDLRLRGEEVRSVLSQPKRLALLLYLSLERAGDFHRRDALLALFWPESTDAAARASLRQAVRFLRLALGSVVVNRGDAEIGIEAGALHCDALEFRRRLADGDDAGALALYVGDLLPGFHVGGSPELEQWVDWERLQYRQQALQAALRLVDRAEAVDDHAAVEWARRALAFEPTDEAVAARLMRLLVGAGNRTAALDVYEQLERRLRDSYELMPSAETTALAASVRAPRAGDAAGPRTRIAEQTQTTATVDRARVLVAVFTNATGDASLDVLGAMAADWIAQGLARVPELQVVPPMAAIGSTQGAITTAEVQAFAHETGAGTIVSGAYYLDGDRLRFHARIVDAVEGCIVRSPEPVTGGRAAPFEAIEQLCQQLTAVMAPMLTPRSVHVQRGAPPPSYEAYRAYMEGLERFIVGDWRGALPHFRRAAASSDGYALPQLVSAIALWNLGELAEASTVASDVGRHRHTMAPFERGVHDMIVAWLAGDWVAAHRAARQQAALAPGSIPHFSVAQEARRLNRPAEAVEVLTQLEPDRGELRGWFYYWLELAIAHHLLGHHDRELAVAERAGEVYPDHPGVDLLLVRALSALGRIDDLERILLKALTSPGLAEPRAGTLLREAGLTLSAHGHAVAAASCFDRSVTWWRQRSSAEMASVGWRRELGRALFHAGQWADAERWFRALADEGVTELSPAVIEHGYLQGYLDEGYLAVIAAQRGDTVEAGRWCRVLEEMRRPFLFGAQWRWRAAVAALQGDRTMAVTYLERGFSDGLPMEMSLHHDPFLGRLRGDGPFDALMKR